MVGRWAARCCAVDIAVCVPLVYHMTHAVEVTADGSGPAETGRRVEGTFFHGRVLKQGGRYAGGIGGGGSTVGAGAAVDVRAPLPPKQKLERVEEDVAGAGSPVAEVRLSK